MSGLNYLAGFAVVEDDRLVDQFSFSAPSDHELPGQLEELHRRAHDLFVESSPNLFALWASEIQGATKQAATAHRAEGAILAGIGHSSNVPTLMLIGQSLFGIAGFAKRPSNQDIIAALCSQVDPIPEAAEIRQATAVARAALMRSG